MTCPRCGYTPERTNKRSLADHARLFALIHKAFHQWPEHHRFRPVNEEHLRAWLIVMAGPEFHRAHLTIVRNSSRHEVAAAMRDAINGDAKDAAEFGEEIDHRFVFETPEGVTLLRPRSMKFTKMSQSEFGRLRDAITDLIEHTIGCRVEDLMQEAA